MNKFIQHNILFIFYIIFTQNETNLNFIKGGLVFSNKAGNKENAQKEHLENDIVKNTNKKRNLPQFE